MSHKDLNSLTIAPATRRTTRRVARPLCIESTAKQDNPQDCPKGAVKPTIKDFVYVVKCELRSPAPGHPIVQPPSLVVDEAYLFREKAIAKMQEVVSVSRAFEIARARNDPHSPGWVNIVCGMDSQTDSWEVVRADGMIQRFFVDRFSVV